MVHIRAEQPGDEQAIHAVNAAAFPEDSEARLVDALRDAGNLTVSMVAVEDDRIVGHVAFSPVTTESGVLGMGLAPVAVLESHRRRGIAASLINAGLEACKSMDAGWMVVLGDPAYYSRFGFITASEFGLRDEYGGEDAFQAMELREGATPRNAGLVKYAPQFSMAE
ncbi:MAG: N-acetyltransferase [Planctomycetota bacterium]